MSVYINHSELPNQVIKNIALHICNMIEQIVSGQTLGVQLIRGAWLVCLRSIRAKCYLAETIRETACARCRKTDHITTNTNRCDAFKEDPDAIIIRSPSHVMCNNYKCNLRVLDMRF